MLGGCLLGGCLLGGTFASDIAYFVLVVFVLIALVYFSILDCSSKMLCLKLLRSFRSVSSSHQSTYQAAADLTDKIFKKIGFFFGVGVLRKAPRPAFI